MSGMGEFWRYLLGIAVGSAWVLTANYATAQITPDRTLPNNSSVTVNGSTFNITGGTQAGRNLFHSFQQFSVPTGGKAIFNNELDIQNIFNRVTGGSASSIDGTIQANGTANVFFLNPAGIVFGKNASLNIGGSFVATTANAIQFGSFGTFSASVPNNPALLTVNPSALLYNQISAGASIQNSSTAPAGTAPTGLSSSGLRVPDGKSLLLVGSDINMDGGRLSVFAGHVELGGLASPGTVGLGIDGNNLSLSFPLQSTKASVFLLNGASVNVSAGGGGGIIVNASNLNITGDSQLNAGIAPGMGSVGAKAGDITLNATGDVKIDGSGSHIFNNVGSLSNAQNSLTKGNGGNIEINTSQLELTNGAQLQVNTLGQGDAGNIIINASKSVSLDGGSTNSNGQFINSVIFSTVGEVNSSQNNIARGNGGNIQITTDQLSLSNGAGLVASTYGQGNAGNVIINATEGVSLNNANIFSTVGAINDTQNNLARGNSGNIQITTDQLSLSNGAQLQVSTFGQGDAGNVIINATKSVFLNKAIIFSSVGDDGSTQNNLVKGNGGNIQITTDQLSLSNGAQLQVSTFGQGDAGDVSINASGRVSLDGGYTDSQGNFFGTGIFSTVYKTGIGKGGNINIKADSVSLTNRGQLQVSTFGQGDAGNININARNTVSLDGGSYSISDVFPNAIGNGGDIRVTTGSLLLTNGANLSTFVLGQGNAGNITINARDNVHFDGVDGIGSSGVGSSLLTGSVGKGGNIQITTGSLSVTNGAEVNTDTDGRGNAGNITIDARDTVTFDGVGKLPDGTLLPSVLSSTLVSNGIGNGGDIHVTTRALFLKNGAELNAGGLGQGNAGSITIDASDLVAIDGISSDGQFDSWVRTSGNPGNGGNIVVNTRTLSLTNGELSSVSSANGGDITIHARDDVYIANGALLAANSLEQGIAGNVEVISNSIRLDYGFIIAGTNSGKGGNITLTPYDFLLLRNGSQISTTSSANGNGGNITINTPNGFVVAAPNENNDITANAFNGAGGVIKINALGIYNFNQRSLADLETLLETTDPNQLDPQQLPTNDITAISLTNPTLSGQVNIVTPDIDPTRGLATLPTITENPPKLVSSNCRAFNEYAGGSQFAITGRGGLPPSPDESLTSDVVWTDARLSVTTAQQHHHKTHAAKLKPLPIAIIPATGWTFNDKGEVTLISTATNATSANTPTSCPVR